MFSFLSKKPSELERLLQVGQKANDYARSQIIKSSTQLENNLLDPDYSKFLKEGVEGSKIAGWKGQGIRDIIKDQMERRQSKGERIFLAYYNSVISVTSKFSLGNCHELAIQALRYILDCVSDVDAEVYTIGGGDHAFLVLGRDPFSEAHDSNTWGPNAVVCDPLKNEVYPAKELLKRLRNYFWDEANQLNKEEPYDPNKHFLMPSEYFNTMLLRPELKKLSSKK